MSTAASVVSFEFHQEPSPAYQSEHPPLCTARLARHNCGLYAAAENVTRAHARTDRRTTPKHDASGPNYWIDGIHYTHKL